MEFRYIKRYNNNYYVNENGEVFSVDKKVRCHKNSTRIIKGKKLNGSTDKDGYIYVCLTLDGKEKNERVHRLVLECFLGGSDMHVDHIDGNKQNNKLSNLEYVTLKENTRRYHISKKGSNDLIGLNFNKSQNNYKITRWIDGKLKHFKTFKNFEDALEYNKELNAIMFSDFLIPNSMKLVDDTIRKYYGI